MKPLGLGRPIQKKFLKEVSDKLIGVSGDTRADVKKRKPVLVKFIRFFMFNTLNLINLNRYLDITYYWFDNS